DTRHPRRVAVCTWSRVPEHVRAFRVAIQAAPTRALLEPTARHGFGELVHPSEPHLHEHVCAWRLHRRDHVAEGIEESCPIGANRFTTVGAPVHQVPRPPRWIRVDDVRLLTA